MPWETHIGCIQRLTRKYPTTRSPMPVRKPDKSPIMGTLGKWFHLVPRGYTAPCYEIEETPYELLGKDSQLSASGQTASHSRLRSQEARVARNDEYVAE